ncbi:MAG: MFS transporter, partial [bacterium]|nr:MFS transporter [bacterium]
KETAEEAENKAQGKKRHPFANFKFLFFIFILLPVRTLFAHQWLTLPDYVFRCYPESVAAKFEWITGLNPLIIVIFVPLFAALTRKVKVIDMMLIGTSVSALTTFILVPGPDLNRLIVYVTLFSLGEALWSSRFLEYVADLAPAGQVGAYMGLANLPWFLAKFTTGLYSGFMLEKFIPKNGPADSETLWLIYALIAMITPIGLLIARKWLMHIHNKEA